MCWTGGHEFSEPPRWSACCVQSWARAVCCRIIPSTRWKGGEERLTDNSCAEMYTLSSGGGRSVEEHVASPMEGQNAPKAARTAAALAVANRQSKARQWPLKPRAPLTAGAAALVNHAHPPPRLGLASGPVPRLPFFLSFSFLHPQPDLNLPKGISASRSTSSSPPTFSI